MIYIYIYILSREREREGDICFCLYQYTYLTILYITRITRMITHACCWSRRFTRCARYIRTLHRVGCAELILILIFTLILILIYYTTLHYIIVY